MRERMGEEPVILLDDVLSELDAKDRIFTQQTSRMSGVYYLL